MEVAHHLAPTLMKGANVEADLWKLIKAVFGLALFSWLLAKVWGM